MKEVYVVGMDVHKENTQIIFLDSKGKQLGESERIATKKVLSRFVNFPQVLIGMEVSIGSQHLGKELEKMGHRVKVMPAKQIKAFYTGPKNDLRDALAIARAAMMDFVDGIGLKTEEFLLIQGTIRQRELVVKHRVALCNQLRGILAEQGIVFPQGKRSLLTDVREKLRSAGFPMYLRSLVKLCLENIDFHIKKEAQLTRILDERSRECHATQRLQTIPGFGPLNSLAFLVSVGDPKRFETGRDVGAYLGLVPRQNSSGEKIKLGGITKKGPGYTRSLLIHGARAFLTLSKKEDGNLVWLRKLKDRRGVHKASVAWANKMARIGWALLRTGQDYQPRKIAA